MLASALALYLLVVPSPQSRTSGADTSGTMEKKEESLFTTLLRHVEDAEEIETPFGRVELPQFRPVTVAGMTVDLSITKHVVFMWLSALLLCIVVIAAARANRKRRVPGGLGNFVEMLIVFTRDEIVLPNMGQAGLRYMPYLLTTFFFIMVMNVFGLIPYGASATGNVNITGGLAVIAFVMIQAAAIREQGFRAYLYHLTGGVHWLLWPIMIPIEVLGLFTKAFALCIRLFANMIAGHIVIVSLIGLIFVFRSYIIAVAPAAFVVGIDLLELFVAVLQAYIFTILTAMFMGLGMADAHETHADAAGDA